MNEQEYIEKIRETLLKKKPSYQTTNRKEVRVRCPYCGDSRSDPSAAHLYIEMKPPFKFHCFKCETSGVLNQKTLRDIEIFENETVLNVIEANKGIKNSSIKNVSFLKIKTLKNEISEDNEAVVRNTDYFNKRFGVNLNSNEIKEKFKAILNPNKFIQDNNIWANYSLFNYSDAIGFLSSDASHIVFRDVCGRQEKRYNNLNLFQQNNIAEFSKIYNISSNIDVMQEKVNIVITEGIFDIIGVYLHFFKDTKREKNTIFMAACGKGYNSVILNLIRMGFLNFSLSIFSDSDVSPEFFRKLKKSSPYLKNTKINLFYNTKEKDFGTRRENIKLKKVII